LENRGAEYDKGREKLYSAGVVYSSNICNACVFAYVQKKSMTAGTCDIF